MRIIRLRSVRMAFAAAMLLASPAMIPAHAQSNHGPASVADLAEGLLDAVVNISTSQNVGGNGRTQPRMQAPDGSPFQDFFDEFFKDRQGEGPRNRKVSSLGSGFVIDAEEGIIVTNNHVIDGADDIEVNFADGSKLKAELVGADSKTDLAVLKVEPVKPLTEVPWGQSDKMRIGDWVMAIGNPFGLGGTVTVGIISARGRDINSGPYDNFIQTDAAINRGNSGGPLFNMNGEVIGINTAIISPSGGSIGIGFAVPTELAVNVIDQLREFGETRRGWLGVQIQLVSEEIAESLGLKDAKGALVGDVFKDGPADKAGIQSGDIVLSFDGKEIETMRDLPKIVADTPVGEKVDVVLFRKGEQQTVQVEVGRLEEGEKAMTASKESDEDATEEDTAKPVLGMTLEELGEELRDAEGVSAEVKGVYILDVKEGSSAEDKGIEAGNVIIEVNQEPVSTPADVAERVAELEKSGRKNALLMISSKDGDIRFVVVRIEG